MREIPSLPLVLLINCSGHRKPENRLTKLRKQRSQEAWKRAYTPDFQHGTWKWWFPIGISFSMGPFSGSMFVLGGVTGSHHDPLLKDWRFISWESKGTFSMPPSTTHREYQALILGDYLRGNDCSWLLNGALVPAPLSFLLRHTGVCGVFNNKQPLPAGSEIGDFSFAYYDRCVCLTLTAYSPNHQCSMACAWQIEEWCLYYLLIVDS